ncbi:MAG: hypothetical protein AAGI01_18400 [Myxococcota bacterium]
MNHNHTPRTRTVWLYEWRPSYSNTWYKTSSYDSEAEARQAARHMAYDNPRDEVRLVRRTIIEEVTEPIEV